MRSAGERAFLRPAAALLLVGAMACAGGGGEPDPGEDGGAGSAAAVSAEATRTAADEPWFVDRAAETGLDFVHFNGRSGEHYMPEVTGAGGALVDFDNDGDLDVYLVQGAMLGPGKTLADASDGPRHAEPLTDRVYRNDLEVAADGSRRLRFTDVTAEAGLRGAGYGMGVAAGDFDNDGWVDLYRTNLGPNQLLRNDGAAADGRISFSDVTAGSGAEDDRWSVPAAFFDFDRDGRLDLYYGNYVDFPLVGTPMCRDTSGAPDYCGPDAFAPQPDRLLRNAGPGAAARFADVTAEAGLVGGFGPALGVVAADFDGDGWLDLYVANDQKANNFWRSRGRGADGRVTFRDEALLAGCSVNAGGKAEASMGVDAADFDGDGDVDLFMTHLVTETNTLYRNDGHGMFDDATTASGLGAVSRPYTSFGGGWLDVENDGWLDLLVVSGAVARIEALARRGDPFPLHQPNQLFRNLGVGEGGIRFREVTARAGEALALSEVSRGAAFGDLDNDGDTDVLVVNNGGPVRLLINQVGQRRHWLGVELLVGSPPRPEPGARAAVLRGGRPVQWRRVRVAGSYCSANDPRLLFGLGDDPRVDGVRVVWPDGTVEEWQVEIGRYTVLLRGSGRSLGAEE